MFATRISFVIAAAALSFAAAVPAMADTFESNGRTFEVRYGDLDLASPFGQKALSQRINMAATKVCAEYNSVAAKTACRRLTLDNVKEPVARVIAQAATKARYADAATDTRIAVGN